MRPPPSSWRVVALLLRAARRRAAGRKRRARDLFLKQRGGRGAYWSGFAAVVVICVTLLANVLAASLVIRAVDAGQRVAAEQGGQVIVGDAFINRVNAQIRQGRSRPAPWEALDAGLQTAYAQEGARLAQRYGGSAATDAGRLRSVVVEHRLRDFVRSEAVVRGLASPTGLAGFPGMFGALALLLWLLVLVMQGEGAELDVQRRRFPVWEWLLGHPIRTWPMFLAEMLAPIAANPLYWSAPLFPAILYGAVYGPGRGLVAAVAVGVPLAVALACLSKALEIGVLLRAGARSRGALTGLIGWLAYMAYTLLFIGWLTAEKAATLLAPGLQSLASLPWPWLGLLLGQGHDGSFDFAAGVLNCTVLSAALAAGSIALSVWSARRGLAAPAAPPLVASRAFRGRSRFGRDPLYRKELLWFTRDRGALVQAILVPVSVAGLQLFNMRGLLSRVDGSWTYLGGGAVLFGTYFLAVLGPRSLASEGSALWIAFTWPRGLESLLKAKAWLWTVLSSFIVAIVLVYAAWQYPDAIWQIALVGAGWVLFARSMAEKAVTLATITTSSGEVERAPTGRRWAVQLGMLTFATGVLTLQWTVALAGIVYSMMTAAAMWQNFRARLPYLNDPWSAVLPTPPTLMNAMIAISILVEGGAVVSGFAQAVAGPGGMAAAQAVGYGVSAAAVATGTWRFLANRGVDPAGLWRWPSAGRLAAPGAWPLLASVLAAVMAGAALGVAAHGYLGLLHQFGPAARELDQAEARMTSVPHLRAAYFVMAVFIAPLAEEFLFRGLLFRSLDREWGGWRAVVGNAAFFAVYHPALAWLPVAALGALNAIFFKRTGRLTSAVLLHATYNAVVLLPVAPLWHW